MLSYFPTSLARYSAAVIYMGLMIIYCKDLKRSRLFSLIFLLAYTIAMPFLNAFRFASIEDVNIIRTVQNVYNNLIGNWIEADYDAYTYFTLTIEYVSNHGVGGHHLLSTLLFWVPRKIWPYKAISGSAEIARERHLFDNVSFPYPAIGYKDGGIIGLILFGIFIGFIMEMLDNYYWENVDLNNKIVHEFDILYPVIIMFWFFLYRGDIFLTFPFLKGYILSWNFIVWMTKMTKKIVRY